MDKIRKLLRSHAHKVTPVRVAVLQVLSANRKPSEVETISRRLKGRRFDQATLYRTVHTLEASGVLRRVDFRDGKAYYELAEAAEHHHAVCTTCGRVEDIHDCCAESMDAIALSQSGFAAITQHSLEFFGLCKNCARLEE